MNSCSELALQLPPISPDSSLPDIGYSDENLSLRSKRRNARRKAPTDVPTHCLICGRPTHCYHYDVASCFSCKSFFRRIVVKRITYVCQRDGKCDIIAGVNCKSCRTDRCLMAGMRVDAVQFSADEEHQAFVRKLEERRTSLSNSKYDRSTVKLEITMEDLADMRVLDGLVYLECTNRRLRESSYNPRELYSVDIRKLLRSECRLSKAERQTLYDCMATSGDVAGPDTLCSSPTLNAMPASPSSRMHPWVTQRHQAGGGHMPTIDLLLSVEMAKTMPAFRLLPLEDQVRCWSMVHARGAAAVRRRF